MSSLLIERHESFGKEASSHNSEVVHAGIYYETSSYKARACVRGKELLYRFCNENGIPFRKCGKYIVATEDEQVNGLSQIAKKSELNGVPLELLSPQESVRRTGIETLRGALWSESSGIVDSHRLMYDLARRAETNGTSVLWNHEYTRVVEANSESVVIEVRDSDGANCLIKSKFLINAAGMAAAHIANQFISKKLFEHRPCRGRYFALNSKWRQRFDSLIYPLPDPRGGLGIHLTLDLAGECRLGPDVDWSQQNSPSPDSMRLYSFEENFAELRKAFCEASKKFLPGLEEDDLRPDYVGVRSKLFMNNIAVTDFTLTQLDLDMPSLHLLGIESPGLTSCLALAEDCSKLLQERFS